MNHGANKTAKKAGEPFVIDGWRVDPASLRISNGKRTTKLEPRAMAVLDYLACRPNTVVSRQELEDEVWTGTIVGYDALSNAINKLRKAFGDNARKPRVIETIAKTGYRLIAEVSFEGSEEPSIPEQPGVKSNSSTGLLLAVIILALAIGAVFWWQPWVPAVEPASIDKMAYPLPDKPSIAVLPFTNMSNDAEQEYFVDGMTEDLITDLSKVSGLFVIARNSVFTYKGKLVKVRQVAEDLGVRYVMEGSVQRVGNEIRVNAQLIDATTGGHIWADRYDGVLDDVFTMRDGITRKIVSALKISLTRDESTQQARHSTDNAEAHDVFLQGWAHYKLGARADLVRSIPFLEEAIRLDPGYADAHAVLATVYWDAVKRDWVFDLGIPSFEAEDRANHHQQEALKTPNLLSHAQQSRIYLSQGLTDEALREAEKAVALDPNGASAYAALANTLILTNRPQEGLDAIRKAIRLDPYHPPQYLTMLGAAQFGLEQFEAAVTSFERAIKRNPDSETSLIYLASSYGHLGNLRKADATIETANDLRATNSLSALSLESNIIDGCKPITDGFDFPRFGPKRAQDRLRLGLSKIPALSWQSLIVGSASGASAKTFDSALGEWSSIFQGSDCILNRIQLTIVDETKAIYPSYRNGRIFWYAIDDQRKWEGYWIDEIAGNCVEKKDGSTYWGVVTFRFNDTYTQWKGDFDICGEGRKYPWNGLR